MRPVRLVGVKGRLEGRQLPAVWRRSAPIPIDGQSFLRVLIRPRPIGASRLQITAISRVLQRIRRGLCSCLNVPLGSSLQCNRISLSSRFSVPLKIQSVVEQERSLLASQCASEDPDGTRVRQYEPDHTLLSHAVPPCKKWKTSS